MLGYGIPHQGEPPARTVRSLCVTDRRHRGAAHTITSRKCSKHLAAWPCRTKQIALRIEKTEATVKYHLRRIYSKLGVRSRAMALVTARKAQLLTQVPRD